MEKDEVKEYDDKYGTFFTSAKKPLPTKGLSSILEESWPADEGVALTGGHKRVCCD